jgi:hypothetical protein
MKRALFCVPLQAQWMHLKHRKDVKQHLRFSEKLLWIFLLRCDVYSGSYSLTFRRIVLPQFSL